MIPAAPPRDAATLVLLRDGADGRGPLEVLLLERAAGAAFAPRATVFPGGAVEPADRAADRRQGSPAPPDPRAPGACAIAAIRECYEETGILLAAGDRGRPASGDALAGLEPVRQQLLEGDAAALDRALGGLGLRFASSRLVFCAHWITPRGLPRRYDTRFYLAAAPPGQSAAPAGGGEVAGMAWATPADALDRGRRGAAQLLPPTRAVLAQLDQHRRTAAAIADARRRPVATVEPRLADVTPERYPGLDLTVLGRAHGG